MDFSMLNKLLPPPLTNPFYRTPGEALDAVIRPIQEQTGIPGSYQYIEQGLQKLFQPKTPMQRATVGQPMVLGGRLGYKAADGSWQPRGDMKSENIPQYVQGKGYVYDEPQARRAPKEDSKGPGTTIPPAPRMSPEERAYNAERARIAQLTAQNPEFQNIGQLRNDLRDQGMQIWQQKYGSTPMGQPGGAVGMDNQLMQRTFGYQTGAAPDQQMGAPTLGPSPLVPQVDQSLNPASPNFIGGEGPPLMNFADPRFENMSPEDFQKLLNQVNKK